jgi:hypothetical protein
LGSSGGFAVTPNDGTTFKPTAGLWVGGAGVVAVTMMDGGLDVTFAGVPADTYLPICVTKIKATGTSASSIVALLSPA